MPYRICKSFTIESGHLLSKHPGNCRFPHGHSRTVEVVLESDKLDPNDMVCDLKLVKEALAVLLERYDHAFCLNTEDPHFAALKEAYGDRIVAFLETDPTSEVLAKTVFDELRQQLKEYAQSPGITYPFANDIRLLKVRVTETESSWAEYSP